MFFLGEGAEISTLEYVAPYASYGYRLGMANLWLFQPVVVSVFASDYMIDAVQRTTTAVTIIEGGVKENVVPDFAQAIINHRYAMLDILGWSPKKIRVCLYEL